MLRLGFNKLIGKIPYQLGSLQKLERFQLHYNNLSGPIPASLGNLSSVRSLSFSVNSFEGTIPDALGQLKTLNFLGLGLNQLTGIVPPSIFNLSSITIFTLPFNQLHGNLPSNLGFALPNLRVLNIGHNQFTGALPESLSNGSNLLEFDINGSNFTGKVNIDFGGLPVLWSLVLASNPLGRGEADDLDFLNSLTKCRNLQILDLSNDQFGGVIPISFGNLSTELVQLRLGGNKLWGSIPTGIKNLVNLTELTMEQNNLTGNIPAVIGNLRMLRLLDLSENQFSGNLPSSIANISLSSLTISLNLAQNQLTGLLPSEVSNLKNLGHLDVSENQLSGEIPSGLGSCVTLEQIYMEGNFFEGTIPNSFRFLRGLRDLDLSRNNLSGQIPEYLQRLSLMTLNLSFNEFEGMVPTTGVFKNTTALSIVGNKKLCGGGDGMEDDLRILSLTQRANIAIDVACALEYLHHHCQKPIVHRDLKPSNILLDNDMTAHVSDFGLAKFLLEAMERSQTNQSSSAGLKGTVGYAAPEYGMGGMASTYGDIYSYGILLLEMFTGKRPTDETFKDGLDLHNFVKTALPERILEVLDPLFVAGGGGEEEEIANEGGCILVETKKDLLQNSLTEILKIGVACSLEQPRERMKLGDVIKELQLVRGLLLGSDMTQR
ncbi:hypothetical protein POUND7_002165 [Theobroma cacao]